MRHYLSLALPLLGVAMLPRGVGFAFIALQLDAIVDWGATHRELMALPLHERIGWVMAVVTLAAWDADTPIRQTVLAPRLAWLWRSAHRPRHAGAAILVLCLLAMLPLAAAATLLPLHGQVAVWVWSAVLSAAWTHREPRVLALALLGLVAGLALGPVGLVGIAALPWTLAPLGRAADAQRIAGGRRTTSARRAWGPSTALMRLDLLTLRRLAPGAVLFALLAGPSAALAQTAARVNGPYVGWYGTRVGVVILALAAVFSMHSAVAIARGLGSNFDRSRWPVSTRHRAWCFVGSLVVLLSPTLFGVLGGGAGPWGPVHLSATTLCLCAGAAVALTWRRARSRNHGLGAHLWWCFGVVVVAWQPPPSSTGLLLLLSAAAVEFTSRRLSGERRC